MRTTWRRVLAVAGALLGAAATLLVRLPRVAVSGPSMLPTLRPGDRLLVVPAPPRPDRLVVLRDPRDPGRLLVKRAVRVGPDGVWVQGDNAAASTDSRHLGAVDRGAVVGRPVHRFEPPDRAGWVWRA